MVLGTLDGINAGGFKLLRIEAVETSPGRRNAGHPPGRPALGRRRNASPHANPASGARRPKHGPAKACHLPEDRLFASPYARKRFEKSPSAGGRGELANLNARVMLARVGGVCLQSQPLTSRARGAGVGRIELAGGGVSGLVGNVGEPVGSGQRSVRSATANPISTLQDYRTSTTRGSEWTRMLRPATSSHSHPPSPEIGSRTPPPANTPIII